MLDRIDAGGVKGRTLPGLVDRLGDRWLPETGSRKKTAQIAGSTKIQKRDACRQRKYDMFSGGE